MKHVSVMISLILALSGPALAQDILSRSTQSSHDEPRYWSLSAHHAPRGPASSLGRNFVAHASYYGGGPRRYEPNAHTANGEIFNQWDLTAAHRTLPMGTRLLVTHKGRSVVVRINDRGPALWTGRSLDLSRGAATEIGLIDSGVGAVQVQVLDKADHPV